VPIRSRLIDDGLPVEELSGSGPRDRPLGGRGLDREGRQWGGRDKPEGSNYDPRERGEREREAPKEREREPVKQTWAEVR
jgi:hypothetical protein